MRDPRDLRWENPPTLWDLMGIRNPWRKKRKLKARSLKPTAPIDIFQSDLRAQSELGSPGYRVARNRSGLGYVETVAEYARFQGTMIRSVASGQGAIVREPTAFIAMLIVAIFWGVLPGGMLAIGLLYGGLEPGFTVPVLITAIMAIPDLAVGVFALISVIRTVSAWMGRRGNLAHRPPK